MAIDNTDCRILDKTYPYYRENRIAIRNSFSRFIVLLQNLDIDEYKILDILINHYQNALLQMIGSSWFFLDKYNDRKNFGSLTFNLRNPYTRDTPVVQNFSSQILISAQINPAEHKEYKYEINSNILDKDILKKDIYEIISKLKKYII